MSQLTHKRLEETDLGAVALEARAAAQAAAADASACWALAEQVRPQRQSTACPEPLGSTMNFGSWSSTAGQSQDGAARRGGPGAAGGGEGPEPGSARLRSGPGVVAGLNVVLQSVGGPAQLPGKQAPQPDARLHSAPGSARPAGARRELPFPARGAPSRGWHW
ncbi:unnamed protein product [Prorocentrum cordatum]|uniref:Uncharacterized protein n=1 Tax=Prorocentrum cordatum TaxID=2364126 RepID=A0ABN9TWI3_9DINO|nr:unnamed protein product [Polarella glacialis]